MQVGSMCGSWGAGPSQAMRDRMFRKADTDGDGALSLDEFKVLSSNKPKGPNPLSSATTDSTTESESVEDIFASLDTDGDGTLSQTELDSGMEARIKAFEEKLRQALFLQADANSDGVLSAEEFASIQPHGA